MSDLSAKAPVLPIHQLDHPSVTKIALSAAASEALAALGAHHLVIATKAVCAATDWAQSRLILLCLSLDRKIERAAESVALGKARAVPVKPEPRKTKQRQRAAAPVSPGASFCYARGMNIRQVRFAELVAAGIPATRAYVHAGYSGKGRNPEANAHALMENHGVAARIRELQAENRELSRMTKEEKLRILETIAMSKAARASDRINAIKVHNEMTGDNEPTKMVVDSGQSTLASLQERVKEVRSGLNLAWRSPSLES